MVSKGFFLDLMTFLTHVNIRPNDFLKSIILCTTIPGQPPPHEAAGTYPPAVGQEDDKAELNAALATHAMFLWEQLLCSFINVGVISIGKRSCGSNGHAPKLFH